MKRHCILLGLLVTATAALLIGCGGSAETAATQATDVPVVSGGGESVVAEAVIEPARWSELSFKVAGDVVEVVVREGDVVAAGDLLARLDDTDAQLAVREAEAALAVAEAQLAQVRAGARAEEVAVAEAQLAAARAALSQAVAQRDQMMETGTISAQAQLAAAKVDEWVARDAYQREGWRLGEVSLLQYQAAQAALAAAGVQLAQVAENGAQARAANAAVWAATAQRDVAEAQVALVQVGATEEEVAVMRAQVAQAEQAVERAEQALEKLELRAPFDGVVAAVSIEAGDAAVPGQVMLVLATLDQLQARTVDLTELDVARVAEGQAAAVTVDALPGQEFAGVVCEVALQAGEYRGDVVYAVTVELTDVGDAPLRWGMTALVEFEVE